MTDKLYVLTGRTESGDDIGPYVWPVKPTDEQIMAVFMRDIPEEVEAECCENYGVTAVSMETPQ